MSNDVIQVEMGTRKPPPRFLIHDEIETIPDRRGRLHEFRLRIWRGKDATPVVLVSQLPGDSTRPNNLVTKLANYVYASLLRYPREGMLYFADEQPTEGFEGLELCQNHFEFFGHASRSRLFNPEFQAKEWRFLESVLNQKVER
jgi:hypothetical protein